MAVRIVSCALFSRCDPPECDGSDVTTVMYYTTSIILWMCLVLYDVET